MKTHTITDELLRELHSEADLPLREKIEKEVPGMIRVELEVGKNYKLSNGSIFNFSGKFDEEGDPIGWGISYDSIFYKSNDLGWGIQDGYQPATDEEVKAALIGEAKKRGFEKGVTAERSFDGHQKVVKLESDNVSGFSLESPNNLNLEGWCIFLNGTWATIIEQPIKKTPQDVADAFVTYLEDFKTNFLNKLKDE